MLLLGIDVGTSSVKVSVVDAQQQKCIASAQYPDTESAIISKQPGWAEQSPEMWWQHVENVTTERMIRPWRITYEHFTASHFLALLSCRTGSQNSAASAVEN